MSASPPDRAVAQQLPLHPRDFHVLLTLLDGDCHGYGMVKAIEQRTDGALRLDPANLYRALQRLTEQGLVHEVDAPGDAEEDGRTRRYHGITELGRRTIEAEAERMRGLADAVAARGSYARTGRT